MYSPGGLEVGKGAAQRAFCTTAIWGLAVIGQIE
jgi:hypothetical protein